MYARDEARIATPIGTVVVTGLGDCITGIAIIPGGGDEQAGTSGVVREAERQLRTYFDGERAAFDLPLAPAPTARGEALRAGMCAIPYGADRSYGAVAAAVGSIARAVGGACRRNPFPIVVPCHRVTSAGPVEHYSAGDGPPTKAWLRAHERRHAAALTRTG